MNKSGGLFHNLVDPKIESPRVGLVIWRIEYCHYASLSERLWIGSQGSKELGIGLSNETAIPRLLRRLKTRLCTKHFIISSILSVQIYTSISFRVTSSESISFRQLSPVFFEVPEASRLSIVRCLNIRLIKIPIGLHPPIQDCHQGLSGVGNFQYRTLHVSTMEWQIPVPVSSHGTKCKLGRVMPLSMACPECLNLWMTSWFKPLAKMSYSSV
jgi:hypothetical protein